MSGSTPKLSFRIAGLVGLVAALVHATWVLGLPFQLDDYHVLSDPLLAFDPARSWGEQQIPAFMCRIPMWIAWLIATPFAGEPRSPFAYHVVGLLLHGLVVGLVARVASRGLERRAAIVTASFAGLAGGAMQAISWTAAWSSATYTLFGLLALEGALSFDAFASRTRRAIALATVIGASALVLVAKAPAVVVPAVVSVLFIGHCIGGDRRLELRLGVVAIGVGSAFGWLARSWFLGAGELGYFESATPSLATVVERLPHGAAGLAQALFPWNRDALFVADTPWIAALFGQRVPGAIVAGVVFGLVALAGLFANTTRARTALVAVALVPACLPLAMLYEHTQTNVAARSAYLALPLAFAAWALGLEALFAWRRAAGGFALCLGALVLVDGTLHVARTERRVGAHVQHSLELLGQAAGTSRPDVIVARVGGGGIGSVPALGILVERAAKPPFVLADGALDRTRVESFVSDEDFERAWAEGAFGTNGELVVVNLRPGNEPFVEATLEATAASGAFESSGPGDFRAAELPRLRVGWLVVEDVPASGEEVSFVLEHTDGTSHRVGPVRAPGAGRLLVELPAPVEADLRVARVRVEAGWAVDALAWRAPGPTVDWAPGLDEARPLVFDAAAAPLIPIGRPDWPLPKRLELVLEDAHERSLVVWCDEVVQGPESDAFRLSALHQSRLGPPLAIPAMPWSAVAQDVLGPRLTRDRYRWLAFSATVLFLSPDGSAVLGRSGTSRGRLVLPPTDE